MRAAALVATLALGCGRIGFDPSGGVAGDGGAGDLELVGMHTSSPMQVNIAAAFGL